MVSTRSFILLSLSSLLALVSAETVITSPNGGDTIVAGQPIDITWTTDTPNLPVGFSVCHDSGKKCTPIAQQRPNNGKYTWTPSANLEPRDDYFILMAAGNDKYVSSLPFEVVAPSSTTSSAPPTQTTPSPTGPSSSSDPAGVTTSGGSPSNTSLPATGDSSNNNSAIIGGAVGAVAGVVLIAVALFIWMRKRNQKKLAEARQSMGHDDVETGEKKANGSGSPNGAVVGAAAAAGKKSDKEEEYAPKGGPYGSSSNSIPMAELPAMQQEPVEMMSAPTAPNVGGQQFFVMELDSREIPRPGSAVKPDVDPTSNPTSPAAVKTPADNKAEGRGVSIDGTTVNSETERPRSVESIEQIKESSREGSQRDLTEQQPESDPRTPQAQAPPAEDSNGAGPSQNRDSTPQIGSIPKLGGFDFDTAKF